VQQVPQLSQEAEGKFAKQKFEPLARQALLSSSLAAHGLSRGWIPGIEGAKAEPNSASSMVELSNAIAPEAASSQQQAAMITRQLAEDITLLSQKI
jgi:hypothetical protein